MRRIALLALPFAAVAALELAHAPSAGVAAVVDLPLLTQTGCGLVCYDGGAAGCPQGQHDAYVGDECALFPTHGGQPHPGDCNGAVECRSGTCGGSHACDGLAQADFEALRNAVAKLDAVGVWQAIRLHDERFVLNVARSAIQILACDSERVIAHLPVATEFMTNLARAEGVDQQLTQIGD